MAELKPTRLRDLALIGVASVALGWFLATSFYASLPAIPLLMGLPLLVLGLVEAGLGVYLRRRIGAGEIGDGPGQTHAMTVARSAMLAKASALVGVLVAGLMAGLLIHLAPEASHLHAAALDLPGVIIGVASGVVLTGAAVWLERGCVTPPQAPLDGVG